MAHPSTRRRALLWTVFATNLLSLGCQVLWSRKLSFLFGSTAAVFSTVLTVFLLGLAVGALLGGRIADRARSPWRLLAFLELGIGVYAALSLPLFEAGRQAYLALFPQDLAPLPTALFKFLIVLATMILPTLLIGAVFPLAVRLISRGMGSIGGDISLVYGLDTLGAGLGALLAGFVFVPLLGLLASTLLLGALAVGLGLFLLRLGEPPAEPETARQVTSAAPPPAPRKKEKGKGRKEKEAPAPAPPPTPEAAWRRWSAPAVLGTFFATGAAALLLETGWNRLFYVLNGTSVYSLAVVLAGFLGGLGLGSLLVKRRIDAIRDPYRAVALLYALIALGGVLVFRAGGFFGRVYLAVYQTTDSYYPFQVQILLLLFVLVLLPALAMGANFPLVAKIVTRAPETRGFSVGQAFFWNTLGAVAGAFLGEFALLPAWGFPGLVLTTLAIYVLAAAVFLALSPAPGRRRAAVACAVLLALAIGLSPAVLRLEMPFHAVYYHGLRNQTWRAYRAQVDQMRVLWEKHGFYGHVAIAELGDYVLLKHNGKTDASTSPDDNRTQILMGHLPLLFHPAPKEALNIGLGGGATLRAITHHRELARITQVEIDPLVTEAARLYFGEFNDRALDDPRLALVTNDGRNYMDASERTYDVITSVPPNIWVSGVSGLFTREFYQSARRHLNPGGILAQWTPLHEFEPADLKIALNTITSVFRHAAYWVSGSDVIILASDRPLAADPARVAASLAGPAVAADFRQIGLAPEEVLPMLRKPDDLARLMGASRTVNVDDRPVLEFRTARNLFYFNKRQRS